MLCGFLTGNLLYVKAISRIARKVNVHKEIKRESGYHIHPPEYNLKRLSNQKCPISSARFISEGPRRSS